MKDNKIGGAKELNKFSLTGKSVNPGDVVNPYSYTKVSCGSGEVISKFSLSKKGK